MVIITHLNGSKSDWNDMILEKPAKISVCLLDLNVLLRRLTTFCIVEGNRNSSNCIALHCIALVYCKRGTIWLSKKVFTFSSFIFRHNLSSSTSYQTFYFDV